MATDFDKDVLDAGTTTYVVLGSMHVNNRQYNFGDEVELPSERGEQLYEYGAVTTPGEWSKHPKNPDNVVDNDAVPFDHPVRSGGDGTDSDPGASEPTVQNSGERSVTVQSSQDGPRSSGKESKSK